MKLAVIILELQSSSSGAVKEEFNQAGYIIGAIIAILILGYLVYTLLKPEKF